MSFNLREGQKEIVAYREGMMAVPAVPGAGKTYTLACLASKLIKEGELQEGKILVVTYMNSAVVNFRERIDSFLAKRGVESNSGYKVKTLHSLAMSILKERPDYLLINEDFQLLDQGQQKQIMKNLAMQWLDQNQSRWEPLLSGHKGNYYQNAVDKWRASFPYFALSSIAYLKGRGIDIKKARQLLDRKQLARDSYLSYFLELFISYSNHLATRGLLDFNDLIYNAWRLLKEDKELRTRLNQKWEYIFEDEAQDSNPIQEQILKLLAGNDNLLRVGDSNQAIMGTFTLADPDNFRSFCNDNQVKQGAILASSRSTEKIIAVANYLVKWTRKNHPIAACREALEEQFIKAVGDDDPVPNPKISDYGIKTREFASEGEELAWVAKRAVAYSNDNPEDTVAILLPNRFAKADIAEILDGLDVEYAEIKGINRRQENTIELLEDLLAFLAKPHSSEKLLKLLKDHLLDYEELRAELIEQLLAGLSPLELLYPVGEELPVFSLPEELYQNSEIFSRFKETLEQLREFLTAAVNLPADELILFLAEELEFDKELMALAQGISLYVKDLLRENLHWELLDVVNNLEQLQPSFRNLARKISETEGVQIEPGIINILTKHKAKGLEWNAVFITAVVKRNYQSYLNDRFRGEHWYLPNDRSNPVAIAKAEVDALLANNSLDGVEAIKEAKVEAIKEKIRLLYVAITRAKKRLTITAHRDWEAGNGKIYTDQPSKLFEILEDYIEKEQNRYDAE